MCTSKHIKGEGAPTRVTHTLHQIHWCRFCLNDNIAFFLRKRTMSYVSCTERTTAWHKAMHTVSAFYLLIDLKPSVFVTWVWTSQEDGHEVRKWSVLQAESQVEGALLTRGPHFSCQEGDSYSGRSPEAGSGPLTPCHPLSTSATDPHVIQADNATLSFSILSLKWELQYLLHRPSGSLWIWGSW